ncbi:MAG: AAA family ATPase [Bacteroidetes bacterium]|jgi:exodeoxyribonuclease-5|nr:AAA family ATPase [Bacteroidota bacterium]
MLSIPPAQIEAELLACFGLEPTGHQQRAFHALGRWLGTGALRPLLVLQGAAGTGKTTMMQALVHWLADQGIRCVLLAPTGRAAKVLAARTGRNASTIHKYIYRAESDASGSIRFRLNKNDDPARTVYIVDEASMLGDGDTPEGNGLENRPLLADLVQYAYDGAAGKRMLFLGDPAQLPPVGSNRSPALSTRYLTEQLGLTAGRTTLTEVKRQALHSGILYNATRLREALDGERALADLSLHTAEDVHVLESGQQLVERFCELYEPDRPEACVILCHSNGMAVKINQAIRAQLFHEPDYLVQGDSVLVVKNYYQQQYHELPFIANGDLGVLRHIDYRSREEKYGLEWCSCQVGFQDLEGTEHEITGKVPTSLLGSSSPALTRTQTNQVWQARMQELRAEGKNTRKKDLRTDPYIQCLQLKYGYAITTHKAQGGQWDHVMVLFEPWLFREGQETELLRWSYTALTRAARSLYLYQSPFRISAQLA